MKPVLQDGEKVLRDIALPVTKEMFGSKELATMLSQMKESLDSQKDGLALAAPQIGIPYRIFIVRLDRLEYPKEGEVLPAVNVAFINPEIIKHSRRKEYVDEGCLSVRGLYGKTLRYERATVRAYDEQGKVFERGGGGVLAQAYQHEIDHLDGILFIDHAEDIVEDERFKAHES